MKSGHPLKLQQSLIILCLTVCGHAFNSVPPIVKVQKYMIKYNWYNKTK